MFNLIVLRQMLATFRFLKEYFKVNYSGCVERKLLLFAPWRHLGDWILSLHLHWILASQLHWILALHLHWVLAQHLHSLFISALDDNLQPDSLPQGKNSSAPIKYEAEWAPETECALWRIGNLLWESNYDFSAVRQVA